MRNVLFYRPGERLSLSEMCAARLDGDLIEVGDGYMPMDTVEDAPFRATSIAHLIPAALAACGSTAAWIHGAGDAAPAVLHVRRTNATRLRFPSQQRVIYHEQRADPADVWTLAGVHVLSPLATARELLFSPGVVATETDEGWLSALVALHPQLCAGLREFVENAPRRPGRRTAVRRLNALSPSGATGSG